MFQRHFIWSQVRDILVLQVLLLLVGDFNCILNTSDQKGGKNFTINRDVREFHTFFRSTELIDLNFLDPSFTWCNNCLGSARIWKHIDRAFASSIWLN